MTPLGSDLSSLTLAIANGKSGIREVASFDASSLPQTLGAEIGAEDFRSAFRIPKAMKVTDLRTRMAVLATARALASARLEIDAIDSDRTGVVIGCSGSDMQVDALATALKGDFDAAVDTVAFGQDILRGLSPLWLLVNLPNMVSAHVSIQFNARGPNNTVMTDWIAGLQAIAEAARLVRTGEASMVLAGGADVGVLPLVYASYEQGGLLSDQPGRNGFIPGDGAAIFVIEEREAALGRGATILAEIEGDASCAWADGDSTLARSVDSALRDAGWEDLDLLFVPTTGCQEFDYADRQLAMDLVARQSGRLEIFESTRVRAAIGFPLAAASTIDLGIALSGNAARRRRAVASATGFMGQAAALSLTLFPEAS